MRTGSARLRVVVVGGSLGGLNAALWLRDVGCEVNVFERTPIPLEDRGSGIVLHPSTIRYVTTHQTNALQDIGASARWVRYLEENGEIDAQIPCQYHFTSYQTLYVGLIKALGADRYHLGEECIGFDQDDDEVVVRFATGREERCDLLVCADGVNSTARRILAPDIVPHYAGYVAWRGGVAESMLSAGAFNTLHEAFTYHLMPDGHILAYPIPQKDAPADPDKRLSNWLWYRNVTEGEELQQLLVGRRGEQFTASVPPGFVQDRHLDQMRQDAAGLPPQFQELIAKTTDPYLQVISDVESSRMVWGRVCLIGDAAFTARPHAAAGTAKAAENAWTLAQAIGQGGGLDSALARWEADQVSLGAQLVARSREVGDRLQSGRFTASDPLPFGLYTAGDSVIETDGPGVLD